MKPAVPRSPLELDSVRRQSVIGHLMAVTNFLHRNTMDQLVATGRYPKLSLLYVGYIVRLAESDQSPGDLARSLGVSKQACSNVISELQKQDLVVRRKNPDDSRSSLLSLTSHGQQLLLDGLRAIKAIEARFADTLGEKPLQRLVEILGKLCRGLKIDLGKVQSFSLNDAPSEESASPVALLFTKLNEYCYQALIELMDERGFEGLKRSHSEVIALVGTGNGRIQKIAEMVGVSKQAIAVSATELEKMGYIQREPDQEDKRQLLLRLTPQGEQLLVSANDSVQELVARCYNFINSGERSHFERALLQLYTHSIDRYETQHLSAEKVSEVAESLVQKFGVVDAHRIAGQLNIMTSALISH